MKITPLDIRQKTFEKNFRGYDKDEVSSFLTLMSQEWEKMTEEQKMLQMKFEQAEKEASKLREVEQSLFKTLKTAEDTGASIIEQANKTAELILKEAQMNADALHAESKSKARNMVDQAESQAKNIMEDLKEDIKILVDNYEKLLSQRESLLKSLKKAASEALDNVKNDQDNFSDVDISAYSRMLKDLKRKDKEYAAMGRDEWKAEEQKTGKDQVEKDAEQTYRWEKPAEKLPTSQKEERRNVSEEEPAEEPAPSSSLRDEDPPKKAPAEPKKEGGKKESGSFFDQFE